MGIFEFVHLCRARRAQLHALTHLISARLVSRSLGEPTIRRPDHQSLHRPKMLHKMVPRPAIRLSQILSLLLSLQTCRRPSTTADSG